jgi:hypothetical protein
LLDVALMAAAIYAGVRVRSQWQAAKERENAILSRRVAPSPAPPLPALPPVPPVLPVEYADIAQQTLLDKSRNSTVVVETAPAPAPVPVPPLPFYHGQMRLPGEGTIVILSETAGGANQAVHPGETIGPFKLVGASSQELVFEWGDKTIRKKLDELYDRSVAAPSAPAAAAKASAAPAAPKTPIGPGAQLNPNLRGCVQNDSYDDGAVVDGYRKTLVHGPFGVECGWNKVN